jgi:hypothetical protein
MSSSPEIESWLLTGQLTHPTQLARLNNRFQRISNDKRPRVREWVSFWNVAILSVTLKCTRFGLLPDWRSSSRNHGPDYTMPLFSRTNR